MRKGLVTQQELKGLVTYNPDTGDFTWNKHRNWKAKIGDKAGSTNTTNGYGVLVINKRLYLLHRLAFLYMTGEWPKAETDHINNIRNDNRWCNLREADVSENRCNTLRNQNNSSGFKGVYLHKPTNTWYGQVRKDRVCYSTNGHKTAEDADKALRIIRQNLHGTFTNHGGNA